MNERVVDDALQKGELRDSVIELSVRAGDAILDIYEHGDLRVETKSDNSPLTAADIASHRVLIEGLSALTPDIPILSEEGEMPTFSERASWSRYWIIDPLDGTKEFVKRNGEFTVNVALIENHIPILGVVSVPVKRVVYSGQSGVGAWRRDDNGERKISTRSMSGLGGSADCPVSVVASRSHGSDEVDRWLAALQQQAEHVALCNMGSSLKLCLVAEGEADVYPRLAPTCEWDTAAAQAVVEAAGGQVVKGDMEMLRYNTKAEFLNPSFYVIGDASYPWHEIIVEQVSSSEAS